MSLSSEPLELALGCMALAWGAAGIFLAPLPKGRHASELWGLLITLEGFRQGRAPEEIPTITNEMQ